MVWSLVSRERMMSKRNTRLYRPCIIHSQPVLELSAMFLASLCYFPSRHTWMELFQYFLCLRIKPFLLSLSAHCWLWGLRTSTFQASSCLGKIKLLMLHHHEIFWGLNSFTRDLPRGRAVVNMCLAQSFDRLDILINACREMLEFNRCLISHSKD